MNPTAAALCYVAAVVCFVVAERGAVVPGRGPVNLVAIGLAFGVVPLLVAALKAA